MPQRRQKEIRIWIQPMELERCVLFFVLQIARTNKKPGSLQITEHSLLTQNCWVMRGVALFPRVSWGFAKSLLGRLLARSLEWQRQNLQVTKFSKLNKKNGKKTFRKKTRCCPHIYPNKGTTLSEPQLASWWREQLLGLTLLLLDPNHCTWVKFGWFYPDANSMQFFAWLEMHAHWIMSRPLL